MLEKIWIWIAWKLPKDLVKWVISRAFANATTGIYSNTECTSITAVEVMQRWMKRG
jgi:hypothetical protein